MELPNFNEPRFLKIFYIYGTIVFFIVGSAGVYSIINNFSEMSLAVKCSSIAMNSFYYILSLFFFGTYKSLKKPKLKHISEDDLNEIFT